MGLPGIALAQESDVSRVVTIRFDGTVTQSAQDTLTIRRQDGSLVEYSGDLPSYPLKVGDDFSFTAEAVLPTRAFYDTTYAGPVAEDGIYRLRLTSPDAGTSPVTGYIESFSVSSPLQPTLNLGQLPDASLSVVYDYGTDSYSLDGGENFFSGSYGAPGYIYDADSATYLPCSGPQACRATAADDPVIFGLQGEGGGTQLSTSGIRVNSTDPSSGMGTGFFDLIFSGGWNLPTYPAQSSSGATPVPAPGMLVLFGAGAAGLAWRRRRAVRSRRA